MTALVAGSQSMHGQQASIVPINPKISEQITITYNPAARDAAIRKVASLTLRTLVLRDLGGQPVLIETPMEKTGSIWKASLSVTQGDARFLIHQFVSGNLKDDNAEQGWGTMIVGTDGKPMKAGRYWHAALQAFGGYMGYKFKKDIPAARSELVTERKLFPDNYSAVNLAWYLETNPVPTAAGTAHVKKELRDALKLFRKNDDALPLLLVWFDQVGESKKSDSLRKIFIAENPKGKVAASTRLMGLSTENDPAKKIKILEQHLAEFPLKDEDANADRRQLVPLYAQKAEYDKGYGVLKASSKSDLALYRVLTMPMIEKGIGTEKAVAWVSEGIDILRRQDQSSKPLSTALDTWKQSQASTLASLLQTRGQAYTKLGNKDAAENDFAEAYALTKGGDLSINLNLVEAYLETGKNQKAEEEGLECIRKGKSDLKIVEKLKAAYTKVHGSLAGYDKSVQQARNVEQAELLKSGVTTPAPDFSLRNLGGGNLKLDDQRGKVLVVTFWSTWSGTSREALPHLQKVFEAYQYYRTVSFVTINAAENVTGVARDTLVKKTLVALKCAIPVGFDEMPGTAEHYGIEGIPSTYVIDRNGMIRFKHIGFRDGNELVNDLSKEIEALLKN